jgi:3-hydroxymyristoyl/3-hydroxydecanoyl-(acyl carrier protein) dehydratase
MSRDLRFREVSAGERVWQATAEVPRDLIFFDGHFVDTPVLPAVTQLEALVVPAVAQAWPSLGRLERLGRVKFKKVVSPGDVLRVHLERAGDDAVRFQIQLDDEVASSGTLHFVAP